MMLVTKCFSSVFGEKTENVYITATTLGKNISDDDYRGEADPNMHIPFFLGLYHEYGNIVKLINEDINESIQDNDRDIYKKEKKWFKSSKDKDLIEKLKRNNNDLNKIFCDYQSKLQAVTNELLRNSNDFITIKNGQKITFNPELI